MTFETHPHRRNGLGARNENGFMVCGICGQPFDDEQSERPQRGEQPPPRIVPLGPN